MIFQRGSRLTSEDLELPVGQASERAPSRTPAGRSPGPVDERVRGALRRAAALGIAARRGSVTSRELVRECEISGEQARRELVAPVGSGRSTASVVAAAPDMGLREAAGGLPVGLLDTCGRGA